MGASDGKPAPVNAFIACQIIQQAQNALFHDLVGNASRCVVIGVVGESMEPTLLDGSKTLIDRQRTRRQVGDIFVIAAPDGLVVKRAGRNKDGGWLMVSDHPVWEDVAWPDEAKIIGRVVWTAKTLVGD